jgi:uncharacterized membrane protein YqhA
MFRYVFEKVLVLSRLFVLLPVVFGVISSGILFIAATSDLIAMIVKLLNGFKYATYPESLHSYMVSEVIGAVDLYLIAIVLLIFSFGLYELFISEITPGKHSIKMPAILSIGSLDELKDKLAKVIVMVLVVSFFRKVLFIQFNGALEMMYFAISISALSVGVYLLHKDSKFKKSKTVA